MSSWCIGLKAGPAGFPERVRPGATGCPPADSGVTNPLSAFAITCASSSIIVSDALRRSSFDVPRARSDCRLSRRFLLRGPAPRGYNGDGENVEGTARASGTARGPRAHSPAENLPSPISIQSLRHLPATVKVGGTTRWPNGRPYEAQGGSPPPRGAAATEDGPRQRKPPPHARLHAKRPRRLRGRPRPRLA